MEAIGLTIKPTVNIDETTLPGESGKPDHPVIQVRNGGSLAICDVDVEVTLTDGSELRLPREERIGLAGPPDNSEPLYVRLPDPPSSDPILAPTEIVGFVQLHTIRVRFSDDRRIMRYERLIRYHLAERTEDRETRIGGPGSMPSRSDAGLTGA